MGTGIVSRSAFLSQDVDIGITGYFHFEIGGTTLWITTTHLSLLIVVILLTVFALFANRVIKKANPEEVPSPFVNVLELLVEFMDNMTKANMGKRGKSFANYIATLMIVVLVCNISGLFGLRPPTADYGVTLPLALITFVLIHYNGFRYEKVGHVTKLFSPIVLTPINIIGEVATPLSMSLRLFGNILSGTVMMGLLYGLIPKLLQAFMWPVFGVLHIYFDVFSGVIQAYVFCMLTMVFIAQNFPEDEAQG